MRRVNQKYVLPTSTKLDFSVSLASASFSSQSSDMGHPIAANIAIRACFISAFRYHARDSLSFEKFKGSKPLSPGRLPSSIFGLVKNGKDKDISDFSSISSLFMYKFRGS